MDRINFEKAFVDPEFIQMRLEHMAQEENDLSVRSRIERELAVMIDDLVSKDDSYENYGRQLLSVWQGYMMALTSTGAYEEED